MPWVGEAGGRLLQGPAIRRFKTTIGWACLSQMDTQLVANIEAGAAAPASMFGIGFSRVIPEYRTAPDAN